MCVSFLIILSHFILSPYNIFTFLRYGREKITISGKVVFDNYANGIIKIGAWSNALNKRQPMHPPDISRTKIFKPGSFQLPVPKDSGLIYLYAVSMPRELPFWIRDHRHNYPFGSYKNNPLEVKASDIKGVLVVIK